MWALDFCSLPDMQERALDFCSLPGMQERSSDAWDLKKMEMMEFDSPFESCDPATYEV